MTKKKKKTKDNRVLEWNGWKAGDLAYGKRYNGKSVHGEIKQFYLKEVGMQLLVLKYLKSLGTPKLFH